MRSTAVALKRKEEALASGGLGFTDALESPCTTCDATPCCSHLPLPGFPVENLMQVDHARWLLGFEAIELGISASGDWSVFYTAPCRFLGAEDRRCTLHGTPEQPRICAHYNPYTCWYRRALEPEGSPDHVRIDARRLSALMPHLRFDEDRNLIGVPTWEALQQIFQRIPLDEAPAPAPEPDPVMVVWRDIALGRRREPDPRARSARQILDADPCDGCAAHCCKNLQFWIEPPTSVSSVDYLRFALGFPGVELGVADDGWSLIVRTRCRHLDGGRCSVYGQPERPLRCQYFDAAQCPYPTLLGEARPQGFVRVELDQISVLEECMSFDDAGMLTELPGPDHLRAAIEQRWAEDAAPAAELV